MMTLTSQIDQALGSDSQFGSTGAIEARNLARFRLGLRLLSERSPGSAEVLGLIATMDAEALGPLFRDPVLRNAFEDDIISLENGASGAERFARYLRGSPVADLPDIGPCERLMTPRVHPWPEYGNTWIWTTPQAGDDGQRILSDRLTDLLTGTFSAAFTGPVVPDDDMCSALGRGGALLAELLPRSGGGVLPHISVVGFAEDEQADGEFQSLSGGDPLPAAVFLAPHRLGDPWSTAETLLHEGLHLKLFEVLRACSFVRDPLVMVPIPWRLTRWTLIRAMFALHVYCHLLLFRHAAENAPAGIYERYGRPPDHEEMDGPSPGSLAAREGGWRTVAERSRYLAQQVRAVYGTALTAEGGHFVDRLLAAVEPLAPGIGHRDAERPENECGATFEPAAHGYRRAERVAVCALPEQRQLVALSPDPARFHWLNEHAWLIYALCDDHDLHALRGRYVEAVGTERPDDLNRCLAALLAAGLLVPRA